MNRLRSLLLALVLVIPLPGLAQTIYLDVNGDGIADAADVLSPSAHSVDIWLVTDRNGDGSVAVCPDEEPQRYTLFSYSILLRAWGDGAVAYGAWIPGPAVSGLQFDFGSYSKGTDFIAQYGGTAPLEPGRYRMGTVRVSVTGTPRLSLITSSHIAVESFTGFGTDCVGGDFDNTSKLGADFTDAIGTAAPSHAANSGSAWAVIQQLYH